MPNPETPETIIAQLEADIANNHATTRAALSLFMTECGVNHETIRQRVSEFDKFQKELGQRYKAASDELAKGFDRIYSHSNEKYQRLAKQSFVTGVLYGSLLPLGSAGIISLISYFTNGQICVP